jgi:sugar diacid utilization regulator
MLLSATSLQETLQVIRVVVSVVEDRVTGRSEALKDATLLYSREVAFAAANVYARAAEARGLWDARLEALVVDSILTGERDDQLPSRIAALGWHAQGEAAVLIGTVNAAIDTERVRRTGRKIGVDVLMGVQGARLVLVLGRSDPATISTQMTQPLRFTEIAERLSFAFSDDPIVLGPSVDSLVESAMSARAALAAIGVAKAWRRAPRPTLADDLLPERALAGDVLARQTLVDSIYEPLKHSSSELLDTIWCYLDNGRSLEATARELFVHPNTVRYRLKKVSEIIGWDATGPREALIIQAALIVGTVTHPSSRS